ncbi:MAG: aspartate aminotransferase family protein [Clostridiales bacterium]|jgi:acetylornithine/succinyldiaminopimelate/putrescine aminotransferase|nr:aspartate aminotransferase family protein [Clostridiales bacterium]
MKIIDKGKQYVMNTYGRYELALDHGDGCYVWDVDGKKYLDFGAGIAVNALGHNHARLAEAIARQAGEMLHVSNLYWTKQQVELAERLITHSPFDKVFFCNSGAEAVEGSLKLARQYAYKKHLQDKDIHHDKCDAIPEIISMAHSFHGRTFGALSVTGQTKYQKGFAPLLPGVKFAEYNDFDSLLGQVTDNTCAIILEPIQGEGGIHPASAQYLQNVRALCNERDIVLIFDEVQCGVGRTGKFFAFDNLAPTPGTDGNSDSAEASLAPGSDTTCGVVPDVACLAKGLAGGVPIGAVLARGKFADALQPGEHASTFGGNPLATTAAAVVLDELFNNELLEHVTKVGKYLSQSLTSLKNNGAVNTYTVLDVRGVGLLQGIELNQPASEIVNRCMAAGLLLVPAGANVIRFAPPLIVTEQQIDEAIGILQKALE